MTYFAIITYPGSGTQLLLNTGEKAVSATEENHDLLVGMCNRLLDEHVIQSYQIVKTVTGEINVYNADLAEIFDKL